MSLRHPVAHVTREMRFQKNENEMYFHEMYFHDMYFRDNAIATTYIVAHMAHIYTPLYTFTHIYTHGMPHIFANVP